MRSTVPERDDPAGWDVARPEWAGRVAGNTMAGFGVRSVASLRMVPHPAVTVFPVLGVSPAELDGAVVALDDLWGREAALICERLSEVSSWDDRFALTDAFLARRGEAAAVDPEVAWAWDRIVAGRGLTPTMSSIAWSRGRARPGSRPTAASPTSPTCTGTSWRSPG